MNREKTPMRLSGCCGYAMIRRVSRRAALLLLVLAMPFSAVFAGTDVGKTGDKTVAVGILHVNDIYQIEPVEPQTPRGGLARLATLAETLRRDDPALLFVFGGDTLSPSVESSLYQGRQMIAAWNALRIDLAVPGNHEFDFGDAVLRERLAESRFAWLAANVHGTPPLPALKPAEIRVIRGVRIGVVGLLTPATSHVSRAGPGIRFEALLPAARREVAELRRRGADVIVGLTHCSLEEDRRLAASGLFDLILGGHDHQPISERVGRTPILKAGADARAALHVRMHFSFTASASTPSGPRLTGIDWDAMPVDGRWAEDASINALAGQFARQTEHLLGETIAVTDVALDVREAVVRREESNFGNFAADSIRAAMGSDVALLNGGGLRGDRLLGPGPLTRRDVAALMPFNNPLVVVSISGARLREVLEYGLGLRIRHGFSGGMPQVSGMRIVYDPRRPEGRRIVSLTVGGQPVHDEKSYSLATSSYLAAGGDGYPLPRVARVLRAAETTPIDVEVVIEAMRWAGRIAPARDGRLIESF